MNGDFWKHGPRAERAVLLLEVQRSRTVSLSAGVPWRTLESVETSVLSPGRSIELTPASEHFGLPLREKFRIGFRRMPVAAFRRHSRRVTRRGAPLRSVPADHRRESVSFPLRESRE